MQFEQKDHLNLKISTLNTPCLRTPPILALRFFWLQDFLAFFSGLSSLRVENLVLQP